MTDLTTHYLGLSLKNPLVPSSSPMTGNLDEAKRLEEVGAAAIVLPSLFEESIHREQKQLDRFIQQQFRGHSEADSYHPVPDNYMSELDNYLDHLQKLKQSLSIPVIASLNGISDDGWVQYGKQLVEAGADALELNVYYVAADPTQTSEAVEQRYITLLKQLKQVISVPVAMKLSSQFSSPGHLMQQLESAGADGVVLFNRFYQPDIDLETLEVKPQLELSSSVESLLRIRWIALLRSRLQLSMAATGGFHTVEDVLKALLAGADAVYLCSVLLQQGAEYCGVLLKQLTQWLEEHEYDSVQQMKGSVSQFCAIDPSAYEHSNYIDVLRSYRRTV